MKDLFEELCKGCNAKALYDEEYCDACNLKDDIAEHDAEIIDKFAEKIKEYSGEHYVDCDGWGCKTELVFRTDEWLDYIVEQMKEQINA